MKNPEDPNLSPSPCPDKDGTDSGISLESEVETDGINYFDTGCIIRILRKATWNHEIET